MALDLASLTDVGLKRQQNEDSVKMLVPPSSSPEAAYGALFIVADGMGGLGGGDIASKAAIDQLVRHYYYSNNSRRDLAQRIQNALESANTFVREQAPKVGLARIGSTAAGLVLAQNGEAVIFNVGDCRVYRLRGGKIERVSRDQSVTERQLESGQITEEAAAAMRSPMVTAYLGQPITIEPVISREQTQPNDVYIICSDGLWGLVKPDEISRIVRGSPAHEAAQRLVKLALRRGGNDNITVIVLRLGDPPRSSRLLLPLAGILLVALIVLLAALLLSSGDTSAGAGPTETATPTVTFTPTIDNVPLSPTAAVSPRGTNEELIQILPTRTPYPSNTPTITNTPSLTFTPSRTRTPSVTPTVTASRTNTPSITPSPTATSTATITSSPTVTNTATATPTATDSPTRTPSRTPLPTNTLPPTITLDPVIQSTLTTYTPSPTFTPSITNTPRPRPRFTRTPTPQPTSSEPTSEPFRLEPPDIGQTPGG